MEYSPSLVANKIMQDAEPDFSHNFTGVSQGRPVSETCFGI